MSLTIDIVRRVLDHAVINEVGSLDILRAALDAAGIDHAPYAGGIIVDHGGTANLAMGFTAR